jgi:rfaE bifunctional protein kinase chain/domain
MLDEYLVGDVERISPEAPVPVVRVRDRRFALGGAANVAQNVVASGAEGALVGVVGNDAAGRQLAEMLAAAGVQTDGLITTTQPTTRKTRVLARSQQLVRIDEEDESDVSGADAERLTKAIARAAANADAIVLEDYNKGVLVPRVIRCAIEAAQEFDIPVVVDPKYRHFFEYHGATVFKPNRRELEAALGAAVDLASPDTLPMVLKRLGVEALLLTLGERGMVLATHQAPVHAVPTVAREVYDVVGAGDTVTAYLAGVLAAGGSALEAAVIANYAAGVEVGKLGASTVTPAEILEAYDEFATQREHPSSSTRGAPRAAKR